MVFSTTVFCEINIVLTSNTGMNQLKMFINEVTGGGIFFVTAVCLTTLSVTRQIEPNDMMKVNDEFRKIRKASTGR